MVAGMEKILIINADRSDDINALQLHLESSYQVDAVDGSPAALARIDNDLPDLILIDVALAALKDYALCRILKAADFTRDIPVILIANADDNHDRTLGLDQGAVDYVTRPFSLDLVSARIRSHLDLKIHRDHLEDELQKRYTKLQDTLRLLEIQKENQFRKASCEHTGRLAALGEMATAMAHEVSQPLNVISIIIQGWQMLQRKDLLEQEKMLTDVPILLESVGRITSLIDHVRTLGHSSQEMIDADIIYVLQNALSFCQKQFYNHGIELDVDYGRENYPNVKIIKSEMEQVFLNLLSNARYALTNKAKQNDDFKPVVQIKVREEENCLLIEFSDNGDGVDKLIADKIFEPFFTTKIPGEGTGLGLSLSRQIVDKFHGRMDLIDRAGEGATFRITLPVSL